MTQPHFGPAARVPFWATHFERPMPIRPPWPCPSCCLRPSLYRTKAQRRWCRAITETTCRTWRQGHRQLELERAGLFGGPRGDFKMEFCQESDWGVLTQDSTFLLRILGLRRFCETFEGVWEYEGVLVLQNGLDHQSKSAIRGRDTTRGKATTI